MSPSKYIPQKMVQGKDIRYYIDIDLRTWQVINRGLGNRFELIKNMPDYPTHRVFLTKGQYDKLENAI